MCGIPPARCHKQTRHGKNPVCHDSKTQRILHPGRQVLFLLMIVLLVSTLKLSELTQLFSTSVISLWCKHHAFLFVFRGSFCIRNFSEITTKPRQKSNHLCNLSTQLTYATITYFLGTHLSFRLVVVTGWLKPTVSVLVAPATKTGVDMARWGCFIAGMSFACLAPPHHAHHVR